MQGNKAVSMNLAVARGKERWRNNLRLTSCFHSVQAGEISDWRISNKHRPNFTRTLASVKPYVPRLHDFRTFQRNTMEAPLHLILLHDLVFDPMLVRREFEIANQTGIAQS